MISKKECLTTGFYPSSEALLQLSMLSPEVCWLGLLNFLELAEERQECIRVTNDTAGRFVRPNQIPAAAACHADPFGVNASGLYNFIGKIRVRKSHSAEQHTVAKAFFDGSGGIQIRIPAQIGWRGSQDRHLRNRFLHSTDSMDHTVQANKWMLLRLIFPFIKGPGHMGCGIGIAHGQVQHVQTVLIMQQLHQTDGLCQIGGEATFPEPDWDLPFLSIWCS